MRNRDNSLTTKKYISDSLLYLLRTRSYADLQIREICQKAGVNRSTYYRNFNAKEGIIKHFYETLLYQFQFSDSANNNCDLEDYLYRMFTYFYKYKQDLLLLHKEALSYVLLEVLNQTFLNKQKDSSMEKVFGAYYHTGGIFNTFLLWFDQDMKLTPKEMTSYSVSILPNNFEPFLSSKQR